MIYNILVRWAFLSSSVKWLVLPLTEEPYLNDNLISDVQHSICIHIDIKAEQKFYEALEKISNCFDNVFLAKKREDVIYTHFSMIKVSSLILYLEIERVIRCILVTVMLVTSLCLWHYGVDFMLWLYDVDWFEMSLPKWLCWRRFSLCWWFSQWIQSVTNISILSPTHWVSNIRHQCRCNRSN